MYFYIILGTQVPTMPVSIEDPQNIVCEGEVMASAVFQSRLKQKMSEYEMKSDADKYHQVQQYVELIQAIWELDHPDDVSTLKFYTFNLSLSYVVLHCVEFFEALCPA